MTDTVDVFSMREALACVAAHIGATAVEVQWAQLDGTVLPDDLMVPGSLLLQPVITVEYDHGAFVYEHRNPVFGFAEQLDETLAVNVRSLAAELGWDVHFKVVPRL